jgi:hypothetical protein
MENIITEVFVVSLFFGGGFFVAWWAYQNLRKQEGYWPKLWKNYAFVCIFFFGALILFGVCKIVFDLYYFWI